MSQVLNFLRIQFNICKTNNKTYVPGIAGSLFYPPVAQSSPHDPKPDTTFNYFRIPQVESFNWMIDNIESNVI